MSVQILQYRPALVLGAALFCLTGRGHSADFESLLRRSPFGRPDVVTTGGSAIQPLEFRGVMFDGGKEYFSVHETKTRSSLWVEINEPGNPYTIRGYDTDRGILTVEYQGSILDLPLKDAVILVSSPGRGRPSLAGSARAAIAEPEIKLGYRDAINARIVDEAHRRRVAVQSPPSGALSQ